MQRVKLLQMIASLFLFIGVMGLFAMTWLFPLLTRFTSLSVESRERKGAKKAARIAILIPAFNEERNLKRTLRSIKASIAAARKSSNLEFVIWVGADGCTDGTARVARQAGARVLESKKNSGKWGNVNRLARAATGADWVILADAGIVWPVSFLAEVAAHVSDPSLVAIAPTYRAPGAGALESLVWNVERHFKSLETSLGGPISIHGATICYRRRELLGALKQLGEKLWLNDDVVVPLTLRALYPTLRIRYLPTLGVHDDLRGTSGPAQREFGRRRRMVYGNLQWIRGLLPAVWERNSVAGLLALRRAFRVLWAYWGLALAIGVAALVDPFLVQVALAAGLAAAVVIRGPFVKLWDSARASLLAPVYFFSETNLGGVVWK